MDRLKELWSDSPTWLKGIIIFFGIIMLGNALKTKKTEPLPAYESSDLVKIKAFNDVDGLRDELSSHGIGTLKSWHENGDGYISLTDYYQPSGDVFLGNNFAYYLTSKDRRFVQTLKLVLNINKDEDAKKSKALFSSLMDRVYSSLGSSAPKALNEALSQDKNFAIENDSMDVRLELDRSKIKTWKFSIEAKKSILN